MRRLAVICAACALVAWAGGKQVLFGQSAAPTQGAREDVAAPPRTRHHPWTLTVGIYSTIVCPPSEECAHALNRALGQHQVVPVQDPDCAHQMDMLLQAQREGDAKYSSTSIRGEQAPTQSHEVGEEVPATPKAENPPSVPTQRGAVFGPMNVPGPVEHR
jgi:hypothetical protein